MENREAVIQFKNVYKRFGDFEVLKGLDLSVYKGESLVIMGPSGSGKSVLLKHIIGLLKPDKGEVWTLGHDTGSMTPKELSELRKRTGYVFQLAALFDSMTVAENVALGLTMHSKMSRDEIQQRVVESLHRVGLHGVEEKNPEELSGGMKKRVSIARAVALEPEILFYDEPTTGLDPATCKTINQLIRQLNGDLGITSVVVTHDIQSATTVADRIVLYNKGVIVSEGDPGHMAESGVLQRFIQGETI